MGSYLQNIGIQGLKLNWLKFDCDYLNCNEEGVNGKWMFKTRIELLLGNKYSFLSSRKLFSLCNLKEIEDVFHFMAVYPILKELKVSIINKTV